MPPSGTLDYGAGRGLSAAAIGTDSLEPYPQTGIFPTFQSSAGIPSDLYGAIVCLNVLNVLHLVPRAEIVTAILRILRLGGAAVIMTRGRGVLAASQARRRSRASPLPAPAPATPPPAPKRRGRPAWCHAPLVSRFLLATSATCIIETPKPGQARATEPITAQAPIVPRCLGGTGSVGTFPG